MVATVLAITPPGFGPAQQRPDDRERAMHRPSFYDEPQIHTLISSSNEAYHQLFFQNITDRERSRFPCFPTHFRILAETPCLHGCSKLFDPGECSCRPLALFLSCVGLKAFNSIAANHGVKHEFVTISYPISDKSTGPSSGALSEYDIKESFMEVRRMQMCRVSPIKILSA